MHHRGKDMSSVAFLERARDWAEALEDDAAKRNGVPLSDARPMVAREVGVSPGTLENLRKRRLKSLGAHIYDALQRATVRRLERELARIEHELQLLKQQGEDPRSGEVQAVLASREAVRQALGLQA